MLHGFSKSMFHRKFHPALLGLKIVLASATSQKNHRHRNWLYNCRSDHLLLCWPGWILYAAGFLVFHAVANGLAALMDPKTLAQTKTPSDSN